MKNLIGTAVVFLLISLVSWYTCVAGVIVDEVAPLDSFYGMSISNTNVYQIDPSSGTVTTVSTTALFASSGIAFDGYDLYYWEYPGAGGVQGFAKWDPNSDTHTLINADDSLEHNAASCVSNGELLVVDVDTDDLYSVNKATAARTKIDDISDNTLQFNFGDISCGPEGNLYISTGNVDLGYDTYNDYIWDPGTGVLTKYDGMKYNGLAWYKGKLYGSRNVNGTGGVFEINPATFGEVSQVASAPQGVPFNDLGAFIPEPVTLVMLILGGCLALIRPNRQEI